MKKLEPLPNLSVSKRIDVVKSEAELDGSINNNVGSPLATSSLDEKDLSSTKLEGGSPLNSNINKEEGLSNDVELSDYYKNRSTDHKVLLIVISDKSIEFSEEKQYDLLLLKEPCLSNEAEQNKVQEKFNDLMENQSTLNQVKHILDKLKQIGFKINKHVVEKKRTGSEALVETIGSPFKKKKKGNKVEEDTTYLSLSLSEEMLMKTADLMDSFLFKKKMKPFLVPPLTVEVLNNLENSSMPNAPLVFGGYFPFTIERADGLKDNSKNVSEGLAKILNGTPIDENNKMTQIYSHLCGDDTKYPVQSHSEKDLTADVPDFVHKISKPNSYPGIFEQFSYINRVGQEDRPTSIFSPAEISSIASYLISSADIEVDILDKGSGAGRLLMRQKVLDHNSKNNASNESKSETSFISEILNFDFAQPHKSVKCFFPKKVIPFKTLFFGTAHKKYATNPTGLIHFQAFTNLHDGPIEEYLKKYWATGFLFPFRNVKNFFSLKAWKFAYTQPIELLKDYFGVKIALYYMFLQHLINSLIVPSIVGSALVAYDYNYSASFDVGYTSYDTPASPYYSLFIIFWAIHFIEMWKRKEFDASVRWGTVDFEKEATYRKQWIEYYEALEGVDHPDDINLVKVQQYDSTWFINQKDFWGFGLIFKQYISMIMVFLSVIFTLFAVFCVYLVESWQTSLGNAYGIDLAIGLSTVIIIVLGLLYKAVAKKLTTWENYATDFQEEDALINKTFLFDFFNSYSALYFLAFGTLTLSRIMTLMIGFDVTKKPCMDTNSVAWAQIKDLPPQQRYSDAMIWILIHMWNSNGTWEPPSTKDWLAPPGIQGYLNITSAPSALVVADIDGFCPTLWCNYGISDFDYTRALSPNMTLNTMISEYLTNPGDFALSGKFGTCASCTRNDCISQIASQLLTILLFKALAVKVFTVLIPVIKSRSKMLFANNNYQWYEVVYQRSYFHDVLDEYQELAVMYGYVVLFAVTYPFAPLFFFVTANVDLRSDAYLLLNARKCMPQRVRDIGAWLDVFQNLTYIAVLSNISLICFVANNGLFPAGTDTATRWMSLFLFCFFVGFVVMTLSSLIPDISSKTLKIQLETSAKMEYLHKVLRYKRYYQSGEQDFTLAETADESLKDKYVPEGLHLTKKEMQDLKLDQLFAQEETVDAKKVERKEGGDFALEENLQIDHLFRDFDEIPVEDKKHK